VCRAKINSLISSPSCGFLLKKRSRKCYTTYPETLCFLRRASPSPSSGVTHTPRQDTCREDNFVVCTPETAQSRPQLWSNDYRIHTHEEYCEMRLILGVFKVELLLMHRNYILLKKAIFFFFRFLWLDSP
jgi:hypothetical protein